MAWAIMSGYKQQLQAYEERMMAQAIDEGIAIEGRNPDMNRQIVRDELHRNALTLLHQRRWTGKYMGHIVHTEKGKRPDLDLDIEKIKWLSKAVQFFELAFDWNHMGYEFYPYCWASRDKWPMLQDANDKDPEFLEFLRAGAARVVVPVQPGYEETVLKYTETGTLGQAPGLHSARYRHIATEFRKKTDADYEATPVGTSWEVRVPTAHVMITEELPKKKALLVTPKP